MYFAPFLILIQYTPSHEKTQVFPIVIAGFLWYSTIKRVNGSAYKYDINRSELGMKLFLVRHGQSVANREQYYAGQSNVPLTEQGRREAAAIRPILENFFFDHVYSSDLSRALDTQRLALPNAIAEITPLLREVDVGTLTGKSFSDVQAMQDTDSFLRRDFTAYGGEDMDMHCNRIRAFLSSQETKNYENVIAFTHGGTLTAMLRVVLGSAFNYSSVFSNNCAIHIFEYSGGKWRLLAWNYLGNL